MCWVRCKFLTRVSSYLSIRVLLRIMEKLKLLSSPCGNYKLPPAYTHLIFEKDWKQREWRLAILLLCVIKSH